MLPFTSLDIFVVEEIVQLMTDACGMYLGVICVEYQLAHILSSERLEKYRKRTLISTLTDSFHIPFPSH